MEKFSDEELLFLSNLMHVRKENDFREDIWTEKNMDQKLTVGEILDKLLKDGTLKELEKSEKRKDIYDGEIEAEEWGRMFESILKNKDLCNMTLQEVKRDDKNALSICLTDSDNNAYVVFRGTGGGEWYDNFIGAFVTDTEQQRRALDFVNSLPYDNITVVGHSKGGNKAKYTALLSDKVARCVSFDGQGFSGEFFEKYGDLVEKNKGKIKNYALDGDFVNILLYDINPEEKIYVTGYGVGEHFEQNHSPSSFFYYNGEGKYSFRITRQNHEMKTLHSFVNYILNTISDEDKEILFPFLGNVAQYTLGKQPPDYTKPYDVDIVEYILSRENTEAVGILLAYLIKYEEYDDEIVESVCAVLRQTGQNGSSIAELLEELDGQHGIENLIVSLENSIILAKAVSNKLEIHSATLDNLSSIAAISQKKYAQLPDKYTNNGEYQIT